MHFGYRAVSAEGRTVSGRIEANSLDDLEMRLKRLDLDLISGRPLSRRGGFQRKISRRQLANFYFHLEQLSRSGVPLLDSLSDLRDSLANSRFRTIVADLIERIEGGQTLSEGMSAHPRIFGPVQSNLVRAGETAGRLPEVLASLTESLKWEDELAAHARQILVYPAVVGAIVLAATFFLMAYLVPQLKQFVANMGQALPLQTRVLFLLSDLTVAYWPFALLTPAIALLAAQAVLRKNPLARLWMDGLKLQTPLIGVILRKIVLSRLARTFAMLYAAGIPILDAIRTTQGIVGNRVIRSALEGVEQAVREGRHLAGAFEDAALFPPLVVRMLRVGENTGNLDRALENVSYFYHRDVKEAVEKTQALVEPLLTLIMGCLIGWIMLSVIGPIYDIVSRIKL
jgi:type IV pilus assembly protein PilC